MDLRAKKVIVVGLAQTGIACAKFCVARGARVVVTDAKPREHLESQLAQLAGLQINYELGGMRLDTFLKADLIVMSPGVPHGSESRAAKAVGIPVLAEIELAYRFLHPNARLIAITGTNGKSTTTALAASCARRAVAPRSAAATSATCR